MSVSRRRVLAAGALSGAASAIAVASAAVASPVDYVPQNVGNVSNPRGLVDPGPQNPTIANEFPAAFTPPTTDIATCLKCGRRSTTPRAGSRTVDGHGK